MTAFVSQAGPWLLLIALLFVIFRWCARQDRREAELMRLFRERQAARYHEMEFLVAPTVFDWADEFDWEEDVA